MKANNICITIVVVLWVVVSSCKKEKSHGYVTNTHLNSYDTIFPLDYFPAYPGSYWKYVDCQGDTIQYATDTVYKPDWYVHSGAAYFSDTFFVPFYNNIPIWGYEAHTGPISYSGSYPLTLILSDTLPVGANWVIYFSAGTEVSRKIIAKDTSVTVSGNTCFPTIVVEEYYSYGPPYYIWQAKRYYTKNIGLVREDIYNLTDSTTCVKELVQYFIND
jgi:hypothetical protein